MLPQKVEEITQVMIGSNRDLIKTAFDAEVNNEGDLTTAVDLLKTIKERCKQYNNERLEIVKPIKDSAKNVDTRFALVINPLKDAENHLKPKILKYQLELEKERNRIAEEERAAREAELKAAADDNAAMGNTERAEELEVMANAVTAKPEESGRGGFTGAKSSIKKRWVFEVDIFTAIPLEYLVVDTAKINAAIRDGAREISGLKIFQKEEISIR